MKSFGRQFAIIFLSLGAAVLLSRFGFFDLILGWSKEARLVGAFIAGIFYTSAFTTGPAAVALGEIAGHNSVLFTALIGAAGATIGDALVFFLFEKKVAKEIRIPKRWRWPVAALGFLVVALPLPDEIGLALMGISKLRTGQFTLLSYAANFAGILILGGVFHTLI